VPIFFRAKLLAAPNPTPQPAASAPAHHDILDDCWQRRRWLLLHHRPG
jgi:hypothetical protein